MSALTKTFVLLHVVMSMLLAAGLIVFVNRLDVSAQANKATAARVARLEGENGDLRTEVATVRGQQTAVAQQAMSQVDAMRGELTKAMQDNLNLRGDIAKLESASTRDKAALASATEALKVAQQNQGTLQGQLADLRTSQDKLTQQFTEANLSINDLNNRLQQTERARRQLAEQLAEVQDQNLNAPRGGQAGVGREPGLAGARTPRSRVEGVIKEKRPIAGQMYATISVGSNDAITRNMQLNVLNRNGQWLGYITVTNVDQEEATGVLSGPRIKEARENDRVTNQLSNQG